MYDCEFKNYAQILNKVYLLKYHHRDRLIH
jgi:hypothetical protein